jgi:hypothetical protein
MTPLRQMEFEVLSDGKVDILMPRFGHPLLKANASTQLETGIIRIHLDEIGSAIWLLIDGSGNVNELCSRLQASYPEKLQPPNETEKRVTQFLSLLYQQKYIREFQRNHRRKNNGRTGQINPYIWTGIKSINHIYK